MTEARKATLTDWVWVEVMVVQALVRTVPRSIEAIGLSERGSEWVITFFPREALPEDTIQDLIEVGGDTECFLAECDVDRFHATDAIHRPVRSEIERVATHSWQEMLTKVDRMLFAHAPD
ncbi:MAG: hypothetical protein DCF16_17925 [Alphaproteobacteria bacterium]|nr:MAG: hypothetical protein DCF16_17925 [Alphaproteobacteria bacterium]